MDISAILTAANPASTTTSTDQSSLAGSNTEFLTLLTTQLKNQDPMSPMDTSQFTQELVEFSGVEQQIKTNDYLQKTLTLDTMGLTGIGLGMVGLDVYSPGSSFTYDGTNAADLSYSMPSGASTGTISILDSSGTTVYSTTANLTSGQHTFSWDGKDSSGNQLTSGTYTVQVGAQDANGNALSTTTYTSGLVTGVETGDDGSTNVIINSKLVPVTDVRQATMQSYAPAAVDSTTSSSTSG